MLGRAFIRRVGPITYQVLKLKSTSQPAKHTILSVSRQLHFIPIVTFYYLLHCSLTIIIIIPYHENSVEIIFVIGTSVTCSTNVFTPRSYSQQPNTEEMQVVDYEYVKKVTKSKDTLIIDVREPDEIKEHGKIPNSVNIPCECLVFSELICSGVPFSSSVFLATWYILILLQVFCTYLQNYYQ